MEPTYVSDSQVVTACRTCTKKMVSPAKSRRIWCADCVDAAERKRREAPVPLKTFSVDPMLESVDWSRHAFRLGIEPKSFGVLDGEMQGVNALTVAEVTALENLLTQAPDSPGLQALWTWCQAVLGWKQKRGV